MKSSGSSGQASRPTAIFVRNREGTIQFLMEWLKVNREVATATYDSVVKVYNEDSIVRKGTSYGDRRDEEKLEDQP